MAETTTCELDGDTDRIPMDCLRCGKTFSVPSTEDFWQYAIRNGLKFEHCAECDAAEPKARERAFCAFCGAEYRVLSADQPDDLCRRCEKRADR